MTLNEWQTAQTGDSAHIVAENRSGLIIHIYGRKFQIQFSDSSEKTYDKDELELIDSE